VCVCVCVCVYVMGCVCLYVGVLCDWVVWIRRERSLCSLLLFLAAALVDRPLHPTGPTFRAPSNRLFRGTVLSSESTTPTRHPQEGQTGWGGDEGGVGLRVLLLAFLPIPRKDGVPSEGGRLPF